MPLNPDALLDLDETKDELRIEGTEADNVIEEVINRVSAVIARYLDRQLISTGSLVEYHTMVQYTPVIYTMEWPIITVTEVAEDTTSPHTYTGAAILAANAFEVSKPAGKIYRIDTGYPKYWAQGHRAIRIKYTGGYASAADVPMDIQDVALEVAKNKWHAINRQPAGVAVQGDALGNFTRFSSAELTKTMRQALDAHKRVVPSVTGERDS
jgi:hypothetical protein